MKKKEKASAKKDQGTEEKTEPIVVGGRYCIPVDKNGRVPSEKCAEGALGIVVQIEERFDGQLASRALKLPKLTGQSYQENAYIEELLYEEISTVNRVTGDNTGLLRFSVPKHLGHFGPIGEIEILFLNFGPDGAPVFYQAKRSAEGAWTWHADRNPQGVDPELCLATWRDACQEFTRDSGPVLVVTSNKDSSETEESKRGTIEFAHDKLDERFCSERVFYANFSSICYQWAPDTLQKDLYTTGTRWGHIDTIDLAGHLLSGLIALHRKGVVHGDLRPANIVKPVNGANYVITDFGSHSQLAQVPPDTYSEQADRGVTTVQPVIGERHSIFYSPLRGRAHETEILDYAKIDFGKKRALLGWKKDVMESDYSDPKAPKNDHPFLHRGARIRLRNYVLQVKKASYDPDRQLHSIIFDDQVFFVSHGRIASLVDPKKELQMSLPSLCYYNSWTPASDLFSLAACLLYTVYISNASEDNQERLGSARKEEIFEKMIQVLSSSFFRGSMNAHLKNFMKNYVDWWQADDLETPDEFQYVGDENLGYSLGPNLREAAQTLTKQFCLSVPGLRDVFCGFEYNSARFLHFVYFCFELQHREEITKKDESPEFQLGTMAYSDWKSQQEGPCGEADFCKHWLDREFKIRCERSLTAGFTLSENEQKNVPEYDGRPIEEIRIAHNQLEDELAKLRELFEKYEANGFSQYLPASENYKKLAEQLEVVFRSLPEIEDIKPKLEPDADAKAKSKTNGSAERPKAEKK